MALTPEQLGDFTKATLDYFVKRYSWQDLSLDLQHYIFADRLINKAKMAVRGGEQLQHRVQVRNTGTFRDTGLYDTSGKIVTDHLENIQVPWAKQQVHYVYEEDEVAFQSRPETILEVLKVRIHSMHNDWFEGMEERMWTKPSTEATKPRKPWGLPTWIVKTSTAGTAGEDFAFNGTDPTGWTNGVGGLSSTTYPNWANGTFRYDNLTQTDLFAKWSEACHKCYFMPPHSYDESVTGRPSYEFFTTYPVLETMHNALFAANDNVGVDIGKYRDTVMFKGAPVSWVPALTNSGSNARDVQNPIYGISWDSMKFVFRSGADRKMLAPVRLEEQPTVHVQYMETWCNFLCLDRRRNFVGNSASWTMS